MNIFEGTRIVVIDIETTGVSVKKAYVREFGAAEFIDGKYLRGSSALFSGGICEPGALRVHKITDDMVKNKKEFSSKAVSVSKYLNNCIIMGHNVLKFDFPIINRIITDNGCIINKTPKFIDTLLDSRKYLNAPSNSLENLCMMLDIKHGKHRALGDCLSCWNLFQKIIEITKETSLDPFIRTI